MSSLPERVDEGNAAWVLTGTVYGIVGISHSRRLVFCLLTIAVPGKDEARLPDDRHSAAVIGTSSRSSVGTGQRIGAQEAEGLLLDDAN